jgi:AraC-like DNA-binding protein
MTNRQFIKIVFLVLFPFFLWSQSSQKINKSDSYEEIKKHFYENANNQSKQLAYANAYLLKAKKETNALEKARGWYLIASKHKGVRAIQYLDSSIAASTNKNNIKYPAYAYAAKANELKKLFRFREALDNFILAEKESQTNNVFFYYYAKLSIAILRSEELGEVSEALVLYKECFKYYKTKNVRNPEYSQSYQAVIFALADAHKALLQSDSATYYNKLGYNESKITKEKENNALFTLNEGANLVLKKNYLGALDSTKKALPVMIAFKNEENILAAYYYLGKAYKGIGNHELAMKNFIKVDSLYNKTKKITPEFMSGYPFLISCYKERKDKENQLKYLMKFMFIDSTLQRNYRELSKKLKIEYDTPHLISEKEILIQSLENDKAVSFWGAGMLFFVIIAVTGYGIHQNRLKRRYKSNFEKIITQTELLNENELFIQKDKIIKNDNGKNDVGISEDIVIQILEKLKRFESQKEYLQSNITVQVLANKFENNSKYISKIVNNYKGKTFIQYINDLRIDHVILQLQKDNLLRKYTIHALAIEYGFNSAESFSTAFYKKTGLKPTFFIRELEGRRKL